MFPKKTRPIFAPGFRRRLKQFCKSMNARAIHTIPHSGLDFAYAQAVARELSLPFFISIHDDLTYTAVAEVPAKVREPAMARAWLDADARFVISESLGREYSRRYGSRSYEIITDGIADLKPRSRNSGTDSLRIYFMGLFHLAYEPNLRALLDGISIFKHNHSTPVVSVRCRCEYIRPHVIQNGDPVDVLPFATERQVDRDLDNADLLYLPMPFGSEHENFARYSISTKMVTYVGSGVPILYHGPKTSAAFELLDRHRASFFVNSLDPNEIAAALETITTAGGNEVAENALELARHQFLLADQRKRFWNTIAAAAERA
jgi:glycosyltransferase involved in cell wall biosynthesis